MLVSSLNVYEFSLLSDVRHAYAVDALLQQVFRNLYFIRSEPFAVISAEDAGPTSNGGTPPHADLKFFRQTMILAAQQTGALELTAIFSRNSSTLRETMDGFRSSLREAFRQLKERVDSEPEIRKNANQALQKIGNRKTATAALLVTLVKPLHDDRLPSENDTVDLLHAVVPGAYADYLVLDGKWASAVTQAARKIRAAGYQAPIAKVFSTKKNGVLEFIEALETHWAKDSPSTTPLDRDP
jgi:hypothetical protein